MKTVARGFFNKGYSCRKVSQQMETLSKPQSCSVVLGRNAQPVVAVGEKVAAGALLFKHPEIGAFAPLAGSVKKIVRRKRDGADDRITIEIQADGSCNKEQLFAPAVIDEMDAAVLKERCRSVGFLVPDRTDAILVTMTDDDCNIMVNRWYVDHAFEDVLQGMVLLKKIVGEKPLQCSLPADAAYTKREQCAEFGRVILVKNSYPAVLPALIIKNNHALNTLKSVAVVSCSRLVSLVKTIQTGIVPTTMPLTFSMQHTEQVRHLQVTIGMTIAQLLEAVHCPVRDGMRVVLGGEFTGMACEDLSHPLQVDDHAVTVMYPEVITEHSNNPCVRCGRCRKICPEGLMVDIIGKCVELVRNDESERLGITRCIQCGLCGAVCITRRPLTHLMATGIMHVKKGAA